VHCTGYMLVKIKVLLSLSLSHSQLFSLIVGCGSAACSVSSAHRLKLCYGFDIVGVGQFWVAIVGVWGQILLGFQVAGGRSLACGVVIGLLGWVFVAIWIRLMVVVCCGWVTIYWCWWYQFVVGWWLLEHWIVVGCQ
jgi:hypothetical protein